MRAPHVYRRGGSVAPLRSPRPILEVLRVNGLLPLLALLAAQSPGDPVAFGRSRLAAAGVADERVEVALDEALGREAFALEPTAKGARVTGGDAAGAMYGLLELAERSRRDGARALADARVRASPFLADRGLNLFLTLPW